MIRVVSPPICEPATTPANCVSHCLGSAYCAATATLSGSTLTT